MDAYEIYKEKIQAEKTFHIGDMSEEEAGVLLSKIARLLEEKFPEYEFSLMLLSRRKTDGFETERWTKESMT